MSGGPVATTRRLTPAATASVAAYTVVSLVHLGAQLGGNLRLAEVTQWVALPWLVLAVVVQTRLRGRLARLAALGLLWCWGGDTLPDLVPESVGFVALMGAFLVAHAFLVAGFWPFRASSLLRTRWVGAYAVAAVLMVLVCAPGAGALTAGVAVYAAALALMAVLATGVHRWAGAGGVLFLVSDALIATGEFVPSVTVPQSGFWVMATYLGAVLLIALGVLRRDRSGA